MRGPAVVVVHPVAEMATAGADLLSAHMVVAARLLEGSLAELVGGG